MGMYESIAGLGAAWRLPPYEAVKEMSQAGWPRTCFFFDG
jgi:hypothetical protein